MNSKRLPCLAGGLAAAALTFAASQAAAHAHLVSSNPAPAAIVAAPKAITLNFSATLEPKFSGFDLTTRGGAKVPVTTTVLEDRKTLVGTPRQPLAAGAYKLTWHAVAKDGHRMQGDFAFTVR